MSREGDRGHAYGQHFRCQPILPVLPAKHAIKGAVCSGKGEFWLGIREYRVSDMNSQNNKLYLYGVNRKLFRRRQL